MVTNNVSQKWSVKTLILLTQRAAELLVGGDGAESGLCHIRLIQKHISRTGQEWIARVICHFSSKEGILS